jgi:hypothetical protein
MYDTLLTLHIAAGTLALASMWIPLVARKGGRVHRRAGWVYVGAMTVLAVTALPLGVALLTANEASRGVRLLLIALITGCVVSSAVRALGAKERTGARLHAWDLGIPAVLLLACVAATAYGLAARDYHPVGAALVGGVLAFVELRYWLRAPSSPMHWWFKHMFGMLVGCLIAANAFSSNLTKLDIWPGSAVALAIVGSVGIPAIVVWMTYYKRAFARRGSKAPSI